MNAADDGMEPIEEAPEVAVPRRPVLNGHVQEHAANDLFDVVAMWERVDG